MSDVMLEEILAELNHAGRKITFLCGHDSNLSTVLGALDATDYELTDSIQKAIDAYDDLQREYGEEAADNAA